MDPVVKKVNLDDLTLAVTPPPEKLEKPPEEKPAFTPVAEPEVPAEEVPPEGKIDKPPPSIDELAELKEMYKKLEARHFYLQRQFERQGQALPPEPETKPAPPANAPKESEFESFEAYQDALVDYKVQQALHKRRETEAGEQNRMAMEQFKAQLIYDGRTKFSDWAEVVEAPTVPITPVMIDIFRQCESPADVAYYLGRNPVECAAISRMTPVQAARAIGKIETVIAAQGARPPAAAPPKKIVSGASPPIKPTGSSSVISKDPNKMTQAEYEQWRREGGGRR